MRSPNTGPSAAAAVVVVNPPSSGAARQGNGATGTAPPGAAAPNRLQEALAAIPLATMFFLVVNTGLFVLTELVPLEVGKYSIGAYLVLMKLQWHRLITSAFFHGGLMHIGMNMMSLFYLGASLERLFGTVQFFILSWIFVALGGVLYVVGASLLAYVVLMDISW